MTDVAFQAMTQLVFVAIFILAVLDFVKRRDRPRLEIALLFGSLALIIVIQGFTRLTGITIPEIGLVGTLVLLLEPYLLLRLVAHFRPLSRLQQAIGLVYVAEAWAIMIVVSARGGGFPPAALAAIVGPFVYIEGYAAVAFLRTARVSRGVSRHRLFAAAWGTVFLGGVILLAGVTAVFTQSKSTSLIRALSDLATLGSAVSYYIGFSPPAWLRRIWQMSELGKFLVDIAGRSADDRFVAALDRVAPAATHAVGGSGAVVLLRTENPEWLRAHPDPENRERLRAAGLETVPLTDSASSLSVAWRDRRPLLDQTPPPSLTKAFYGASIALVCPLVAYEELYGLLVVLFAESPIFLYDELELLNVLADQAAAAIAGAQLVDQLGRQNESLAEASRLKSAFLANMSHELRTPLNAILGFSELLMDSDQHEQEKELHAIYLQRIHGSGKHLLSLINDVLDLAKVEAGRMELHPEWLLIDELVGQVVSTVLPLADQKGILLNWECKSQQRIFADEGKLKQVLYNLLSNAIKFTPAGGQIRVEAQTGAKGSEFTVADSGPGIPPQDQERVFEEFQQGEYGNDRVHDGTGLGLALTRRFVELHGGRIELESEPGKGACFRVLLPAPELAYEDAVVEKELLASTATVAPPAGAPLVLVVEDDRSAAHLLSVYLTGAGYRVEVAENGADALAKARQEQPAAITLDVMLPGMDGWQVLRELKSEQTTRHIPVLIASIVDNEPLGYALGATDYLIKPIDRDALVAKLGRYLGNPVAGQETAIVAVDDDPVALELTARMLEPLHFKVLTATSGTEGLALVRSARPRALLLDLMMPEVTGFDVLTALRLDPAISHVPVFIVTAKDLSAEDRTALNGRVSGVFVKGSLRAPALRKAVAEALEKERVSQAVHVSA